MSGEAEYDGGFMCLTPVTRLAKIEEWGTPLARQVLKSVTDKIRSRSTAKERVRVRRFVVAQIVDTVQ